MPSNIREIIGHLRGRTIVEITADDFGEHPPEAPGEVYLHFDSGETLRFYVDPDRGFDLLDTDAEAPDA